MRIVLFEQWDRLSALLRKIADGAAEERVRYAFNRLDPSGGAAELKAHAVNRLALENESVTLALPDGEPGKVRDFLLRVTATGECGFSFAGDASFEGEEGALDPPGDGESAVYFFTETEPDVFLVARKVVKELGA